MSHPTAGLHRCDLGQAPPRTGTSVYALIQGTTTDGRPTHFQYRITQGRVNAPAGSCAIYIPALDWDLLIPQELYGLDVLKDSRALAQGAPVVVARGVAPPAEGLDAQGNTPSAQSLALIRAAVRHGSVRHPCCWSPTDEATGISPPNNSGSVMA